MEEVYPTNLYPKNQTNIIWQQINWHCNRHIEMRNSGYWIIDDKTNTFRKSKIVKLKPNILLHG